MRGQGEGRTLKQRLRKTVTFDAAIVGSRMAEAIDAERDRARREEPCAWIAPRDLGGAADDREFVQAHLLAGLKAFCDAAQGAGGLPLNDLLEPRDLPGLIERGRRNAECGECKPKVMERIRQGKPVDLRVALALLHFFRHSLRRPALGLVDLGGMESARARAMRGVERALTATQLRLPPGVFESLSRRAFEVAGYSYVLEDMRVQYANLRAEVDERGVMRLYMRRTTSYRPLRLHAFPGRLMPVRAYEWHEWSHVRSARLFVRVAAGSDGAQVSGPTPSMELPVVKRLDASRGLVLFEVDPATPEAQLVPLVVQPADADGPRPAIAWEEEIVLNAADRDIVVSYQPVAALEVEVTRDLAGEVLVSVGDSPALLPGETSWRLGRALMPREVVAVRFRLRRMPEAAAFALSPSGEWSVGTEATSATARATRRTHAA